MAPVAFRGVAFRVSASAGGYGDGVAAGCGVLLADVDVGGEGAFVDDQCLAWGTGAG